MLAFAHHHGGFFASVQQAKLGPLEAPRFD